MSTFSVSGLTSGIDTTALISSLMTLAAKPQAALQSQLTSTQSQLTAYQAVNTAMSAVQEAAANLALATTWQATKATSSDASIVATGSSSALSGSTSTFSVTALAAAQSTAVAVTDPANAAVAANGIDISIGGGTATHIALSGNSADDVASAINAAGIGVKASVVTTSNGSTILQLNGTSSGAASSFTVSGLSDGAGTNLTTASDAQITVGDPAAGGYTLSSTTNTFTKAMPGVTFTVSALTTNSSISITTDTSAISAAVNSLVSAANSALTFIGQVTAKGQTLQGDNTINSLTQQVLGVVSAGFGGKSLETAGIDITATGSLTFDADAFATAYGADPTGVQTMVQNGFGAGMSAVGTQATDATTGNLTQLINNDNTQITTLNTEISDWTTKLADQQASLQAKYAAMTATIAKLQSQSTFLTQMFNSISGNNSSSSSSSA